MTVPVFEEYEPAPDCDCPGCVGQRRTLAAGGHPAAHGCRRALVLFTAAGVVLGGPGVAGAAQSPEPPEPTGRGRTAVDSDHEQGRRGPLYGGPLAGPAGVPAAQLPQTTRADIINRAKKWVTAKVPYSMAAYWSDGYRQDCSGYVSMAWNLARNEWTGSLAQYGIKITRAELQPGDILLFHNPANPTNGSHVTIFGGWTDGTHTSYVAYEQAKPHTRKQSTPMAYWNNSDQYVPYRYRGVATATSGAVPADAYPGAGSFGPGAENAYVTRLGEMLIARGGKRFYQEGPGPRWGRPTARPPRRSNWPRGGRAVRPTGCPGPTPGNSWSPARARTSPRHSPRRPHRRRGPAVSARRSPRTPEPGTSGPASRASTSPGSVVNWSNAATAATTPPDPGHGGARRTGATWRLSSAPRAGGVRRRTAIRGARPGAGSSHPPRDGALTTPELGRSSALRGGGQRLRTGPGLFWRWGVRDETAEAAAVMTTTTSEPEGDGPFPGTARHTPVIAQEATTEIPVHLLFRDDVTGDDSGPEDFTHGWSPPIALRPAVVARRLGTGEQPRIARPPVSPAPSGRPGPPEDPTLFERPAAVLSGWTGVVAGLCALAGIGAVLWGAGAIPARLIALLGLPVYPYRGLSIDLWCLLTLGVVIALFALGGIGRGQVGHAWVLTLFGEYRGSVRRTGLLWMSPLVLRRRIEVRLRHWRSEPMPAVDAEGAPLCVVVQVVWRVRDTARAVLGVEDHEEYLSEQVESAMARVVSQLPADAFADPVRGPLPLRWPSVALCVTPSRWAGH